MAPLFDSPGLRNLRPTGVPKTTPEMAEDGAASLRKLRPDAKLKMPEIGEDASGVMQVRRRLSYADKGQGVLQCHILR